jgi:hypothetical protein
VSRLDGFSGEFDRVGESSSNAVGRADADPSRVDECEVIDRENGLVGEVGVGAAPQHGFDELVVVRAPVDLGKVRGRSAPGSRLGWNGRHRDSRGCRQSPRPEASTSRTSFPVLVATSSNRAHLLLRVDLTDPKCLTARGRAAIEPLLIWSGLEGQAASHRIGNDAGRSLNVQFSTTMTSPYESVARPRVSICTVCLGGSPECTRDSFAWPTVRSTNPWFRGSP